MKLGIFFDSTGYGIVGYDFRGGCFYLSHLEESKKPSLKNLIDRIREMKAEEIYCNDSKVLLGGLYELKIGVKKQVVTQDRETETGINYDDCFETLSVLLADEKIIVSQQIERQFTDSLKCYTPVETSHSILAIFHSVAVEYLQKTYVKTTIQTSKVFKRKNTLDFSGYTF